MTVTTTQDCKIPRHRLLSAVLALMLALAMLPAVALSQAQAAVGNVFTVANGDGIDITYKVLTESGSTGTVQVGDGSWDGPAVGVNTVEVTIPSYVARGNVTYTVANIGDLAFFGCDALASVTIPDSVKSIEYAAFYGCPFTSLIIPDSVTNIGESAFGGCASLTSLTIPDSVTNIGESAFGECTSLTSIIIPDSITSIEGGMFVQCTSLASITIGSSVQSIGVLAFQNCNSLETLIFKGDVAPTLASSAVIMFFNVPTTGIVYYPEGATGYTDGRFAAVGLPSGWVFEAVSGGTTPEPEAYAIDGL
jgi:hypothetical protein